MNLAEKLTLWKWLSDTLATLHKNQLVPQGQEELTPGERLAVKFGGKQVAAWVSLPQPSQGGARVKDRAKLLAWAKAEYPEHVEYNTEVIPDAATIEFLQEHRPESLRVTERVDPQWVADICTGLDGKDHRYVDANGEPLTEVPGIEIPEPSPSSPRVNLQPEATGIIAEAWPGIEAGLREVLALPAAEVPPAEPVPDKPADEMRGDIFMDALGRFRSPEAAAAHAIHVQGGFSTPAREARRMLRHSDPYVTGMAREWLEARGLSLDGDEETPVA